MSTVTTLPARSAWVRGRAIIGLSILAPFVTLALISRPLVQPESLTALGFEIVGWASFLCGGAFRLWATLYIGGRKGDRIVAEGPYSICRNPLYVGTGLICLSLPLFLQSATLAVGLVLASTVYLTVTVGSEEHRLRQRFGAVYEDYCRRTPRFLPDISQFQSAPVIEVNVKFLAVECRRALVWGCIPLLSEVLMHLRGMGWWPQLISLP